MNRGDARREQHEEHGEDDQELSTHEDGQAKPRLSMPAVHADPLVESIPA